MKTKLIILLFLILLIILIIVNPFFKKKNKESEERRDFQKFSRKNKVKTCGISSYFNKLNNKLNNSKDSVRENFIKNSNILCFSGGGIRSITVCTATTIGILRKLTRLRNEKNLNDYLSQYSVISGNSGGSWFMSLLAYSPKYYNMLNSGKDLNKNPIVGSKLKCKGGIPIEGSDEWWGYCEWRDNMQKCGDKCCCNSGYKYGGTKWGFDECIRCEDDVSSHCKDDIRIPGSERWWTCQYDNTYTCGDTEEVHKGLPSLSKDLPSRSRGGMYGNSVKNSLREDYDSYCCCDKNYQADSRGHCLQCPPSKELNFTFYEYIFRMFQVIDNWSTSNLNIFMAGITSLSPNWVRPFIYYYYAPWHKVTNEIIFNTVGDIPQDIKINEPTNNINSHFIWSTAILRYANVMNLDNKAINYYMNAPFSENSEKLKDEQKAFNDLKREGMVFPAFFNYDVPNKKSPINVLAVTDKITGNMVYDEETNEISLDFLTKSSDESKQNVTVRGAASCSGAPVGFLSSKTVIKQAINTATDNPFYKFFTDLGQDKVSSLVSEYFNDSSIPVKMDAKGDKSAEIDIICTTKTKNERELLLSSDFNSSYGIGINNEGKCLPFDFPNAKDIKNVQDIEKQKIVKMVDGGFYDNSSISYALRAWQEKYKDEDDLRCKIVFINSIPNDETFSERNGEQMKTSQNVFGLFGCQSGIKSHYSDCKEDVKVINYFGKNINEEAWVTLPHVFNKDDYTQGKCLHWSRCDPNNNPNKECDDEDNICYAEMSVVYFKTTSVINKELGVTDGTKVDLFTVNFNTIKAPIFINPGSADDETDFSNYITTALEVSKLVEHIPDDLFKIVFTTEYDNNIIGRDKIMNNMICSDTPNNCRI